MLGAVYTGNKVTREHHHYYLLTYIVCSGGVQYSYQLIFLWNL